VTFEFSSNFDSRSLQRELERMAVEAVQQSGQPMLDGLLRECQGKPTDVVKHRLASEWERVLDADITDPDLTKYATALSEGTRIVLTPG